MPLDTNKKLANVYERVIPSFVRESAPEFVEVVIAYFEYLDRIDESVSPIDLGEYAKIQQLLSIRDIDSTLDDFLDQFRFTHLALFPKNMAADFRFIVKMIKSFYTTKGTEESFKLFFEMVFNADVEFSYPKDNLLRASDGKWTEPRYILPDPDTIGAVDPSNPTLDELTAFANIYVQGQFPLVGLESDASGVGEEFINILAVAESKVISLSNVTGNFIPGEYFYPLGLKDPMDDPNYNPAKQLELETLTTTRDVKLEIRDATTFPSAAWDAANEIYLSAQSDLDEFTSTLFYMSRVNLAETLSVKPVIALARTSRRVDLNVSASGFEHGDNVQISGAENPTYNGIFEVHPVDPDNFYFLLTTDETPHSVTISQVAGLATVVDIGHGFKTGDTLEFVGADQTEYNSSGRTITFIDVDSYSFPINAATESPATGTITAELIAEVDAGASITAVQIRTGAAWDDGWLASESGFWSSDDGKVSHVMILQDSDFWQDFSYLLKSEIHISNFLEPILTNLHPAGFKLFSELIAGDGTLVTGAKPKLVPEVIIDGQHFGLIEWLVLWIIELFGNDALLPIINSNVHVITRAAAHVSTLGAEHAARRWFEISKENPELNFGFAIGDLDELPIDYFDNSHGHFLNWIEGVKVHLDDYDINDRTWFSKNSGAEIGPAEFFSGIIFDEGTTFPPEAYLYDAAGITQKLERSWSPENPTNDALIFANGLELKSLGISHYSSDVSGVFSATGAYLTIADAISDGSTIEIIRLPDLEAVHTVLVAGGPTVTFSPPFPLNHENVALFASGVYLPPKLWKSEGNTLIGLYGTTFPSGKISAYFFRKRIKHVGLHNLSASEPVVDFVLPRQESLLKLVPNSITLVGP